MNSRRRYKPRAADRARIVRSIARTVLAVALLTAILAPVAWERLPDFKAISLPRGDRPTGPPRKPDPGIDPSVDPKQKIIIRPVGPRTPSKSGSYTYFETFGSKPPYISTCEPVPFVIRKAKGPKNGDKLILDAMQRLANVTGLSFELKGFTDKIYKFNGRRIRYEWEDDRNPIWIGWATDNEIPDLGPRKADEGYAIGVGGPGILTDRGSGQYEIIGGGVVLRSGETLVQALAPGASTGNVLMHELGHAFGLGHADSNKELMYPTLLTTTGDGYQAGDSRGLQNITQGCTK